MAPDEMHTLFSELGEVKGKLTVMEGILTNIWKTCQARQPACEARFNGLEQFQAIRRAEIKSDENSDQIKKKIAPHWWIAAATWSAILIGDGVMLWLIMHLQVAR